MFRHRYNKMAAKSRSKLFDFSKKKSFRKISWRQKKVSFRRKLSRVYVNRNYFIFSKQTRVRRRFSQGGSAFLKVLQSRHNFFINIFLWNGLSYKNLMTYSCGSAAGKGGKKVNSKSLYKLSSQVRFFLKNRRFYFVRIIIGCFFNWKVHLFLRGFVSLFARNKRYPKLQLLYSKIPSSHNGVRLPKVRKRRKVLVF